MRGFQKVSLLIAVISTALILAACRGNSVELIINFDSNGGQYINSIAVEKGKTVLLPAPIKEGHTFEGWFTGNETNDVQFSNSMPVVSDLTLYARWQINEYTITFESNGGSSVDSIILDYATSVPTPEEPKRIGFTFTGWLLNEQITTPYTFSTMPANNITLYAKWSVNPYTIGFNTMGGSCVAPLVSDFEESVSAPLVPTKEGHTFAGWYKEEAHINLYQFSTIPSDGIELYAKWLAVNMAQVGELGITYTIPTGTGNSGTTTVKGGYLMATTQTTYELWYEVRIWAEAHGYHFQNQGREGNDGVIGALPTEDNKLKPVTTISWRDVIVWSNALSEMTGLNPVYQTASGELIKDSRDANASVVDAAVQTDNNGYRLPTSMEWEMAARWRNSSGDGSILVGKRYWTPGGYASGATEPAWDYINWKPIAEAANRMVGWYDYATGLTPSEFNFTRPVGQLLPNHLGIYDMSGNVWEWQFDWYHGYEFERRVLRGGSYNVDSYFMQVGYLSNHYPYSSNDNIGFRLTRG